ncbi:MAG: hypothetical protein ABH886_09100 [Candidatus Desantisbacteria bacterium]
MPRIRKLKKAEQEIEQELINNGQSRKAKDEEIIKRMGCSRQEYEQIKAEHVKIQNTTLDVNG